MNESNHQLGSRARISQLLLDMVSRERAGEAADRPVLKSLLRMLTDLSTSTENVYSRVFEVAFLEMSKSFYKVKF